MTVSTIARKPAAPLATAKAFAFKGKGAPLRTTALAGVASLAYAEGKSRADTIAQLRIVLGKSPTDTEMAATRAEYIIGRTAQRLAAPDMPKADMSVADRIAFARSLVTEYAYPAKDGTTPAKVKASQKGRRTVAQHKVIRAAEEAWSLVKSEMGFGAARTQAEKNAKQTRKPRTPASGTLTHSELIKPTGPMDAAAATAYIEGMALTMLQFCKKHAGVVPTAYGQSVTRFHGAIAELAKAK